MAKKKKGNIVTIDFTGVEAGGGAPPEGRYEVEVAAVEQEEGPAGPYLGFEYKIIGPGKKKGKLWDNCSMSEQSLWRLRGILETLGVEVPDSETDIDLEELVGLTMGVEVAHEVYNKKNVARITDWFEVGSEGIEDDEDETPPKSKKKSRDEDEEDDEPKSKKSKKSRKEDDEEDEEPKKGKKSKKKKASMTSDDVLEMDEDQLQEAIDEHKLDVDLEEYNTTRRKRAAIVEALVEAGIIEEEEDGEEEK